MMTLLKRLVGMLSLNGGPDMSMFRQFFSRLATVIMLAVVMAMLIGALFIGALYGVYLLLLYYGLTQLAAIAVVGLGTIMLIIIFGLMILNQYHRLFSSSTTVLPAPVNSLHNELLGMVDSFVDGLLTRPAKHATKDAETTHQP